MNTQAFTITSTRQQLIASSVNQREISVHVTGNGTVYLGGSDVTSTNGMLTEKNAVPFTFILPAYNELWAVTASGTENLRLMTPRNMSGQ
jgi:hypothetical protein